ncbi:MAG: CPBP family intramembrane glutamic endopeptidase [Bacteroidota bacterium]
MLQQHTTPPLYKTRTPWGSLCLLALLVVVGAFLGQLAASGFFFFTNNAKGGIHAALETKQALLILQATTASGAFILAPLLYLHIFARYDIRKLFWSPLSYTVPILITLGLVLACMVINTWFIQWNMTIKLPTWLRTFEAWAQEKEAVLQRITILVTSFHSLAELGIGILVIGIIPAIGEELLFRGLVQTIFHQLTNNIHLAIGMSALVFSTIHFQFYGLVPRLLLGALFGYIYGWTRNLLFPIVAHWFNNTLTLLLCFLYQQGIVPYNILNTPPPPCFVRVCFAIAMFILAYYLRRYGQRTRQVSEAPKEL